MAKRSTLKGTALPSKAVRRDEQLRTALAASHQLLNEIQARVLNAPALNGGFDTLLYKVDKIEESQDKIGEKVDSIHEAVFHPDQGLFARVKHVETTKGEAVDALEKDVTVLKIWKDNEEKALEKDTKMTEEQEKVVKDLESTVKTQAGEIKALLEWKNKVSGAVRWGLVTLAGGGVTVIGKLLYDFLSGHISYH
jgi:hypothetical protein